MLPLVGLLMALTVLDPNNDDGAMTLEQWRRLQAEHVEPVHFVQRERRGSVGDG